MSLTVFFPQEMLRLNLTPQKSYKNTLEGVTVEQGILTNTQNKDATFTQPTTFGDKKLLKIIMFSYTYSHFNTNTTPTKFFTRNQQESHTQSDHWVQNPNTSYANFSLSLLREFLIESTQCCRQDSIHYFQEDMGNGLVSPIYRHHLTSIYFFEFLFFFQRKGV